MSILPTGTVTFLFTDIEGSTKLLEHLRGEYAALLAEHHEIMRAAFAKWNGHEIGTQGDSFFVTFSRAADAVACAMDTQRALAAQQWTQGVTVRVRMGLHTGEPIVARANYVGMDVHLAARIAAIGHGGQVLLSQTTRGLIYQDLPIDASLRDLGEHKLKDIRYAQPIFQLNIQGLPSEFPPLKTLARGAETADWIGRTLSKVEIQKLLASGGTADVYLGHHTTLDRAVAVKIIHGNLIQDEVILNRFRAEAQAIAALRHPNIIQVLDFDVAESYPYIVMEWIEGPSLNSYQRALREAGRSLPPETTARLILPLASALDYAHARGIVHRDIKPANVLLRRGWAASPLDRDAALPLDVEPVLSDFGIARLPGMDAPTLASTISGTLAYLSPEQARGETVDARSDIYSLGVMLYEMLAGHPPFEAEPYYALLLKHINELPPPLPNSSPAVQAIVDRALAKDRDTRYQHAGDLATELMVSIFGVAPNLEPSSQVLLSPLLTGLLDTLDLLDAQARTYERAIPSNNYPARAAVIALGELAKRALNEARDLAAAFAPPAATSHPFSPREFEVLGLAAEGLTNKEIAYRLGLSERTIQFHLNSIFNKTGTNSRTEAATYALRQGWLPSSKSDADKSG
jgi:serine/threonine protein kinase/class 3 adenylate cyclase